MLGKRAAGSDESPTTNEGPQDADTRQLQRELIDDVRLRSEKHGVQWGDLLRHAEISKSARSRVNSGVAGLETVARLRRALNELVDAQVDGPDISASSSSSVSAPRRKRWVIAVRRDEKLFLGTTTESDDEIANKGRVRLDQCQPLRSEKLRGSIDELAASLASVGPSSSGVAGPEAPSALLLEIMAVYNCTKHAISIFDARK